jgi:hypothetical protein
MDERLQWLGAAALLIAAVVITALGYDGESTARALGAGFGVLIVPLALTALGRFLYLRFSSAPEGQPFWTPLVFVIAATFALIAGVAMGVEDEQDFRTSVDTCKLTDPAPLEVAPPGLRFTELSAAQEASLAAVATDLPPAVTVDELESRQVVERGRTVAVALSYPGVGSDENFADFLAGFTDGAAESAGTSEELEIAGDRAVVATLPQQGSTVAARSGCNGLIVAAPEEATAVRVARALLTT